MEQLTENYVEKNLVGSNGEAQNGVKKTSFEISDQILEKARDLETQFNGLKDGFEMAKQTRVELIEKLGGDGVDLTVKNSEIDKIDNAIDSLWERMENFLEEKQKQTNEIFRLNNELLNLKVKLSSFDGDEEDIKEKINEKGKEIILAEAYKKAVFKRAQATSFSKFLYLKTAE